MKLAVSPLVTLKIVPLWRLNYIVKLFRTTRQWSFRHAAVWWSHSIQKNWLTTWSSNLLPFIEFVLTDFAKHWEGNGLRQNPEIQVFCLAVKRRAACFTSQLRPKGFKFTDLRLDNKVILHFTNNFLLSIILTKSYVICQMLQMQKLNTLISHFSKVVLEIEP